MITAQLTHLDKTVARALCLQFISHEYARALEIASTFSSAKPHELLSGLDELYPDLIESMPTIKLGIFRKLCFYCEALLENSQKGEELLNALDDLQVTISRERRNKHCSDCIFEKLRAFFPLLSKHFADCRQSEAPLFALVELRESLNKHLGQGAVEQLLQKLYPNPRELHRAISQGFSQRGFESFCKQHEALFEGLAWTPSIVKH